MQEQLCCFSWELIGKVVGTCQGHCRSTGRDSLAQGGAGGRKAAVAATESRSSRAVHIHTALPAHTAGQRNKGHIPRGAPQAHYGPDANSRKPIHRFIKEQLNGFLCSPEYIYLPARLL